MSAEHISINHPRVESALSELRELIEAEYPAATFEVSSGEDPEGGIYLIATVDVQDTDAVVDVVIERLLELQIEERLPVYVIPLRPHSSIPYS
jgi:hypothetical protein